MHYKVIPRRTGNLAMGKSAKTYDKWCRLLYMVVLNNGPKSLGTVVNVLILEPPCIRKCGGFRK